MGNSISVIIPSYNSDKTIPHTLESLRGQNREYLKEIIIVDSSDNEGMKDVIARYKSDTTIFVNAGTRVIPSKGRNIGAARARGDIFVFLDADVILKNDYIDLVVEAFRDGVLAGCGGIGIPEFQRDMDIVVAQYYFQLSEYIPVGRTRHKENMAGCNLFCSREIFFAAGGFPEIRATEDVLFGMNVNKITPTWFVPQATVMHIFREDRDGYLNNQKLLGTYIGVLRSNQSGTFIYRGIMPVLLMPLFFLYKFCLVLSRVLAAGGTHLLRLIRVLPTVTSGVWYWTIGMVRGAMGSVR